MNKSSVHGGIWEVAKVIDETEREKCPIHHYLQDEKVSFLESRLILFMFSFVLC